ncbi:MAG: hypothetical protein A3F43_03050 [Gammaproteobacteria bacterium RIFCSPHIGHO2_12_FULL_42_10]|nr:MAG: hypothetical protein A3F43_03050 [Gammaproteobacteria bacterium RIFCSPHIGHO2_12_FULL_42_10]
MPKRKLIDILVNVNHYTGWATVFGPLSGSDPKISNAVERYILTTLFERERVSCSHCCYVD